MWEMEGNMVVAKKKDDKFTTEIFVAEDSNIRTVYAGQPTAVGGLGTDFRPGQLVLAGYASCAHMTISKMLLADKVEFEDVIVSVSADNSEEGKTKFYTKFEILADIPQEKKDEYIAKGKSCFVSRLLTNEKEFFDMELVNDN